jgi:hypothetical protein
VVDYHVDRPGVEAPQGVELTGTNSSEILLTHTKTLLSCHMKVLLYTAFSDAIGSSSGSPSRRRIKFLAPMAAGIHPFPSRTRQLSPPAPMIVGPQGPSKVGRRQI